VKSILVVILCFALSACVYSQHNKEVASGTEISAAQLQQIELGKTTKQWVLSNFGIPERTYSEPDGAQAADLEVFEYTSDIKKTANSSFIFLFDIDSEKVSAQKLTRIVMRKGIVESVVSK
jgi:outer membrane protein assembly factor BamE (lipoprotein component of BamABCDE complex)